MRAHPMLRRRLPRRSAAPLAAITLAAAAAFLPGGSGGARALQAGSSSAPPGAELLPHSTADWDAERLGNHRVLVRVDGEAPAVLAHIPWRRPDDDVAAKAVIVTDAADEPIANVVRIAMGRQRGTLAFEPTAGAGEYRVYYLPWDTEGRSNYPTVTYPAPRDQADPAWLQANGLDRDGLAAGRWSELPEATAVEIQSVDPFDSFDPMEVLATSEEALGLLAAHPDAPYLLFPEDRRYPVRMRDHLPERWIRAGANGPIAGEATRGEWYAFQIAVWAAREPISELAVAFTALVSRARPTARGGAISPAAFSCVTLEGTDWAGRRFRKHLGVPLDAIQPIWCGVQIPDNAIPGTWTGSATVASAGMPATNLPIELTIADALVPAHGDDEPWRHSRLRWLDSTLALDDEVVAPYEPVRVEGRTIRILGRQITIGDSGLPAAITSTFTYEMTSVDGPPRSILAAPIALEVRDEAGAALDWPAADPVPTPRASGLATWQTSRRAGALTLELAARAEFDGTLAYEIALAAAAETTLSDVRLRIPIAADVARYSMGMGRPGGLRPASFDWSWDVERNQDGAWIGDVNAGLQFQLKDERYERPLNTNFYQLKPLVMPRSWDNGGRGGCSMREAGEAFEVTCFSGPLTLAPGDPLRFDLKLLVTPFHPLRTDLQWRTRFFHRFGPLDEVEASGANTINVHHATEINPYINYPFLRPEAMKAYVDEAHARGMKVKIYYTVRELSNRAPELFALLSLDTEVFADGPGGGFSWLQEHVDRGYIAGWFVPDLKDAAIVTSGTSRWHNYYLEGLDWLARNAGIDGLYIDDVAFDRTVMKRARKILDRRRPGALIDLHSANQFNPRDGFASSANLYLEHFPYIDRLWFGEYFDYDSPPEYWLTEISGIPFGLMGEMLQDGGNPWRGMLYGMTNRLPWSEEADPRPLWGAWDEFGMDGSEMIGYWVPGAPVRTSDARVLATSYLQEGRALIAIASWAPEPVEVTLDIDWERLGIDPATARVRAHAIESFQPAREFAIGAPVPVEPGRGWLLTI